MDSNAGPRPEQSAVAAKPVLDCDAAEREPRIRSLIPYPRPVPLLLIDQQNA
jgi:hypothetical protein